MGKNPKKVQFREAAHCLPQSKNSKNIDYFEVIMQPLVYNTSYDIYFTILFIFLPPVHAYNVCVITIYWIARILVVVQFIFNSCVELSLIHI